MAELTDRDLEYLSGTHFAILVTMNPDGSPQATITWVDAAEGHVLINTARGRVKDRNVRADPRVALTVLRDGNAYDWISVYGTVVDIEVSERAERHIDELSHRYDGHGYTYTPGQVREILKIRPDRIHRYKD
ncbi:MAG TPA: PPOX class F420-dependent oxidoreductase [Actinomycetota bacterium]|jgi:PPOX class probable F420-dependent enzyme|nr:PPOX class F420-dependent oxidoreductase [Actinomycetota bacterium]